MSAMKDRLTRAADLLGMDPADLLAKLDAPTDDARHVILPDGDEYVVTDDRGHYLSVSPFGHGAPPTVIHRSQVRDAERYNA